MAIGVRFQEIVKHVPEIIVLMNGPTEVQFMCNPQVLRPGFNQYFPQYFVHSQKLSAYLDTGRCVVHISQYPVIIVNGLVSVIAQLKSLSLCLISQFVF